MRALICGGRDFLDFAWMSEVLSLFEDNKGEKITEVIHGAARGADTLAGEWAKENNIPVRAFPANWDELGRAAGAIRNAQMLAEGKPDVVIAFPGGVGTADMCTKARMAGITVVRM